MFKILLPSDFSKESENTIRFASVITRNMSEVKLILFHSIYIHGITPGMLKQIEDLLINDASQELNKIKEQLREKFNGNIIPELKIVFGNPVETILDYATEKKIDLILMSRHTTGRFEKVLMGSNSIDVLKHSKCPVLIVPEDIEINQLYEIAYATNLENLNEELQEIIPFVKLFKARLTIVHIYPEIVNGALFDIEKLTEDTIKHFDYDNINFYFSMNNDVKSGVELFISEYKPSLIVFYTRHRSFWESLYDQSLTAEFVLNEPVAMLAIPKNIENMSHNDVFSEPHAITNYSSNT